MSDPSDLVWMLDLHAPDRPRLILVALVQPRPAVAACPRHPQLTRRLRRACRRRYGTQRR